MASLIRSEVQFLTWVSDKAQIAVKSIEDETMKMMGFALPDELPKLIVIPADGQFAQIPNCSDVEVIKQELSKLK